MQQISAHFLKLKAQIMDTCTVCGGQGYTMQHGQPQACACSKEMRAVAALAKGGVPEEYWHYNLSSYAGDRRCAAELSNRLAAWKSSEQASHLMLFFTGPYRVGKTTAAVALAKDYCLHRGVDGVRYVTARELESISFDRDDVKGVYDIADASFLIIDEIGKEITAQHDNQNKRVLRGVLDLIIRARRATRPTVLISNWSVAVIEKWYGKNLSSILSNDFSSIVWNSKSMQINTRTP